MAVSGVSHVLERARHNIEQDEQYHYGYPRRKPEWERPAENGVCIDDRDHRQYPDDRDYADQYTENGEYRAMHRRWRWRRIRRPPAIAMPAEGRSPRSLPFLTFFF